MPRTKLDDGGKPSTFNLYESHRVKLDALATKFNITKSDLIRGWIDKNYSEAFKDTSNELKIQKKNLEEVISALEAIEQKNNECKNTWIKKYLQRKKSIAPCDAEQYKQRSKAWINSYIKDLSNVFPDSSVDEMFEELEEAIKVI